MLALQSSYSLQHRLARYEWDSPNDDLPFFAFCVGSDGSDRDSRFHFKVEVLRCEERSDKRRDIIFAYPIHVG